MEPKNIGHTHKWTQTQCRDYKLRGQLAYTTCRLRRSAGTGGEGYGSVGSGYSAYTGRQASPAVFGKVLNQTDPPIHPTATVQDIDAVPETGRTLAWRVLHQHTPCSLEMWVVPSPTPCPKTVWGGVPHFG